MVFSCSTIAANSIINTADARYEGKISFTIPGGTRYCVISLLNDNFSSKVDWINVHFCDVFIGSR